MKLIDGQMMLELFPKHEPGNCSDEGSVVDIGGGKSYCTPWERWTNCRECGSCVYERFRDAE